MIRTLGSLLIFAALVSGDDVDCSKRPDINVDPSSCCRLPKELMTIGIVEESHKAYEICRKLHPIKANTTDKAEQRETMTCFWECILSETGKLDDEKKVSATALEALLPEGSPWRELIKKSVAPCLTETEANEESKCKSFTVMSCVGIYLFEQCPKDSWTDSAECNELLKYVRKCAPKDF